MYAVHQWPASRSVRPLVRQYHLVAALQMRMHQLFRRPQVTHVAHRLVVLHHRFQSVQHLAQGQSVAMAV